MAALHGEMGILKQCLRLGGRAGPQRLFLTARSSGMRGISTTATSSTTASTSPITVQASTSLKDYRVSLFDAFKFNGPAPEKINGRLSMALLYPAVLREMATSETLLTQLTNPRVDWWAAVLAVAVVYATMVPVRKGVRDEDFWIFTVKAEKVNGRLAMLAWATLILLEENYAHACFF